MPSSPVPVILDCDPGHDDAIAVLLALGSPSIDLLGVTTTFGNCSLADATRNALQVLTLAGATHVPVAQGASGPMAGTAELGNYVHGATGLDGPELPAAAVPVDERGATRLIADLVSGSDTPVVLAATGPITNVATLIQDEPDVLANVREVIFMGGSTERGNHTPYAEFNTFSDPEALDVVLSSGLPVTMVGLNLTHQALATPDVVASMRALQHDVGRVAAEWMGFFGSSYNRVWNFEAPPVHDPCAVFRLIQPQAVRCVDAFVAVETTGRWTRGSTAVDLFNRWERTANAKVAVSLDADAYWAAVLNALDVVGRG